MSDLPTSPNQNNVDPDRPPESGKFPSLYGKQAFELFFDFSSKLKPSKLVKAMLLKEAIKLETADESSDLRQMFPVVISTKQLNGGEIEIKRAWMFWKYYNELPYKTETIVINRDYKYTDDLIYESYCDFGYKEETV